MDQEFVIHSFDNDLLGRVLRHIEAQLQHLVVTLILDEGTVEAIQPSMIVLRTQGTAILSALLRGSAGGALEEVVALAVHQLAAEPRHLVLHLSHLGIEAFAYVGELGVDDAEVAELDGNVALDTTVSHVSPKYHTLVSCHCQTLNEGSALNETQFDRDYRNVVRA